METKQFIIIWMAVVWVIIGLLFGVKYFEKQYVGDNNLVEEHLQEEYNINTSNGDMLVTCIDGTQDIYRPSDITQINLCGEILTPATVDYLNSID